MISKFQVRRPLRCKEGQLLMEEAKGEGREADSGKAERQTVMAKLEWPELKIDNGGGWKNYTWLLVRGIVRACKDSEDKQLYAFEVEEKVKKDKVVFFATSKEECDEWSALMRKYAVHHDLDNGFIVSQMILGKGSYSTVVLATDRMKKEKVALKIIAKSRLNREDRQLLVEEVRISQELDNIYCVKTYEFIELADKFVLVMEYVSGGELFEKIVYNMYPEEDVRRIMRQLMGGVAYLHSLGVCHRDLKPENFLLSSEKPLSVKIADFGISINVDAEDPNHCLIDKDKLRCSPGYGAPEIVCHEAYGLPADMWSMGVVLYVLLTGIQPFNGSSPEMTKELMRKGEVNSDPLKRCSPLASDLVFRLLDRQPESRITAEEALQHPWLDHQEEEEEEEVKAPCFCWGRKQTKAAPSFRDPSVRSLTFKPSAMPTFMDVSVRNIDLDMSSHLDDTASRLLQRTDGLELRKQELVSQV